MIETLGKSSTALEHKVAVLVSHLSCIRLYFVSCFEAVDLTSSQIGGSILGDKTHMANLASDPNAFIRPSPSGGALS